MPSPGLLWSGILLAAEAVTAGAVNSENDPILTGTGWGLVGLGGLLVCWGLVRFFRCGAFLSRALATEGVIVGHEQELSTRASDDQPNAGQRTVMYYAVVEFEDVAGQKQRFRSGTATGGQPYGSIGDRMPVWYLAEAPAQAKIQSFWELWGLAVLLVPIGLLMAGGGWLLATLQAG